jgi:hypothetical protein
MWETSPLTALFAENNRGQWDILGNDEDM